MWKFSIVVPIAFFIRPTSALLFLCFCIYGVFYKWEVIFSLAFTTIVTATVNTILDYSFFERLVIPFYNFLIFNVVENKSERFGVEPPLYYLKYITDYLSIIYYPILFVGMIRFFYKSRKTFRYK